MKYNPYCKNLRTRVFDIETTGLYPQHDRIISASFCNPDGSDLLQFFCDAPQNEDILIEQILDELSKCDAVITYNGNMFDIPFVLTRAKHDKVAEELPLFWSIDVYRWLKAYWPQAKKMESLRQKAVEEALGLSDNRTDEIGGGECISLYADYVNWNNEKAKELILLHNGDDVRQLARISQSLSFLPYHQIAYEKGFMAGNILINEFKLLKNKLSVKAKMQKALMPIDIYDDQYHLEYDSQSGDINLDIFFQTANNCKFVDITKIFKDLNLFKSLPGYKEGFLILSDEKGILYKECNILASEIVKKDIVVE